MSLMPATWEGAAYCVLLTPQHLEHSNGLLVWDAVLPGCLRPSVYVCRTQNPRLAAKLSFLGVMPTPCGTKQTSADAVNLQPPSYVSASVPAPTYRSP